MNSSNALHSQMKKDIISQSYPGIICLCEPYHHFELPGYVTLSGKSLPEKTKVYTQISWRDNLPVETVFIDVDLIIVRLNIPSDAEFLYVFCVYLSHDEKRRLKCLQFILEFVTKLKSDPNVLPLFVLVGDFNKNLHFIEPKSKDETEKRLRKLIV